MQDLISRQAAIDLVKSFYKIDKSVLKIMVFKLKQLPFVPRKGHWVGIDDEPFEDWECDRCGYTVFANDVTPIEYNFCPNCGCRMEEGDPE